MEDLNPHQLEAAKHVEGPLLVLAGAGSGKTRVVTHRISNLLSIGIVPTDILAVTFTNRAADEMRTRIRAKENAHILACTFHSLGARILRESIASLGYPKDFVIYDEEDSDKLFKNCMDTLGLSHEKGVLKQFRMQISTAKNNLQGPDAVDRTLAPAYTLYQSRLRECGALDFDDLLYLTAKLLQEDVHARSEYQNRWLFVLIDEYQDTNYAQHTLAKLLVEKHRNVFAVGDPDQSIYSWRGARYQNILNFERDFPGAKIVTLDQNYRSTNTILQAANHLISHNETRYEKKLWSALPEGAKIGVYIGQNERHEAEFVVHQLIDHIREDGIPYDDVAIFYRTNAQSRTFEDALLARRIPYRIIGGLSFYQRKEIKDLLSFLRMLISNADLISFLRTIHLPKRGLGPTTIEKMIEQAAVQKMPIFTFCEELLAHPDLFPGVKLGAKQREGLQGYVGLIHRLRNRRSSCKLYELLRETIQESHYLQVLKEDPESFDDRKENIDELIGKAAEWEDEHAEPTLTQFLEELSLRTTTEEGQNIPSVHLMTLHNSKGLEFPLAFLVGMEEELFPHVNSLGNPETLEEERRLCYVGMTRAKKYLYLSCATYRYMWGGPKLMRPSRFFREIPSSYLKNYSPTAYEPQTRLTGDGLGFTPGERVYHREFGNGVIQKTYHTSLGLTYEVAFEDPQTTRSLVAKFAKLKLTS
jgi:DNA helicase-2/ATP-dependent DNA helicase PcrA